MIRAVKSLKVGDPKFVQEYKDLKNFWNVTPYLEELLGEDFTKLLQQLLSSGIVLVEDTMHRGASRMLI